MASGYCVYVGCYCSGAKDRKYQHGLWTGFYPSSVLLFRLTNPTLTLTQTPLPQLTVGSHIKFSLLRRQIYAICFKISNQLKILLELQEIPLFVYQMSKSTECISAHLLKTRISIQPSIATFVLTYAPTEEAPEGQEAKYVAALTSTVASMPAREYIFVYTDANARTGKLGEGRRGSRQKSVGCIWLRRTKRKRQTTSGFRRRQEARSSDRFVSDPQTWRVLHVRKR